MTWALVWKKKIKQKQQKKKPQKELNILMNVTGQTDLKLGNIKFFHTT